jgi:branched-chain amino acid transport system ATP-binding protein
VSDLGPLIVSGLQAGYGRLPVVTDVSFQINPGETVALVGRNGAGKTTSLAAVAGLRYGPGRGRITIGSENITAATPDRIVSRGLKLVPEGRRIFRSMTVAENLRLGAFPHRQARRQGIADDLARVWELFPALSTCAQKLAGELSGGQQQMVAIGQALMCQPRFLLLDEPSSGLAPTLVDEMYDRLDELGAQGLGLLVVDQSVERVLERSHRYYLMESGAIVQEGTSAPDALEDINAVVLATSAAEASPHRLTP